MSARSVLIVLTVLLASALVTPSAHAQTANDREAAVIATLQKLFDGMQSRDTAAMRSVFDSNARLMRAVTRDGQTTVQVTTVDQFVTSIAGIPAERVLVERIYAPEVRIDGNLATVWTFYTLHVSDQLSHCGIDAAHLFEINGTWKISHLADTFRRENCEPPKN